MIKKTLLVLVTVIVCSVTAWADNRPTLYAIIFADTKDSSIGIGVEKSLRYAENIGEQISAALEFNYDCTKFYADICRPDYLKKWVSSFKCTKDDVVLFFYFGHGTRSKNDTSIFPQMCLGLGIQYQSEYVSLEAVKNSIMAKGPGFCLVFGDCCNNVVYGVESKVSYMKASSPSEVDSQFGDAMKKLFGQKGCVIASGCRPGEFSWINTSPTNPFSGFFLMNFLKALKNSKTDCTWEQIMQSTHDAVANAEIRDGNNKSWKQHPIWRIELGGRSPKPNIEVVEKPKKDVVIVENKGNKIKQILQRVGDDRLDNHTRDAESDLLARNVFAEKAVVRVVGQDMQTVIYIGSSAEYLSRIRHSARLRGITLVAIEEDVSGKISRLTVHETYLKKQ